MMVRDVRLENPHWWNFRRAFINKYPGLIQLALNAFPIIPSLFTSFICIVVQMGALLFNSKISL